MMVTADRSIYHFLSLFNDYSTSWIKSQVSVAILIGSPWLELYFHEPVKSHVPIIYNMSP